VLTPAARLALNSFLHQLAQLMQGMVLAFLTYGGRETLGV
jgi:hypothetical protein